MSGIKAKISETVDKLTHRSGTEANQGGTGYQTTTGTGAAYGNTGNTGNMETTGYDTRSSGMTGSEGYTTTGATDTGASMGGTGQVIDSETFTKTEDHERLIEKKKYELEHHPVEKQYVVETKFVGEQNVPGGPTEVVGHDQSVVDERIKKAPAGDRTVVVENVDVPASELRSTTTGVNTRGNTY